MSLRDTFEKQQQRGALFELGDLEPRRCALAAIHNNLVAPQGRIMPWRVG